MQLNRNISQGEEITLIDRKEVVVTGDVLEGAKVVAYGDLRIKGKVSNNVMITSAKGRIFCEGDIGSGVTIAGKNVTFKSAGDNFQAIAAFGDITGEEVKNNARMSASGFVNVKKCGDNCTLFANGSVDMQIVGKNPNITSIGLLPHSGTELDSDPLSSSGSSLLSGSGVFSNDDTGLLGGNPNDDTTLGAGLLDDVYGGGGINDDTGLLGGNPNDDTTLGAGLLDDVYGGGGINDDTTFGAGLLGGDPSDANLGTNFNKLSCDMAKDRGKSPKPAKKPKNGGQSSSGPK